MNCNECTHYSRNFGICIGHRNDSFDTACSQFCSSYEKADSSLEDPADREATNFLLSVRKKALKDRTQKILANRNLFTEFVSMIYQNLEDNDFDADYSFRDAAEEALPNTFV